MKKRIFIALSLALVLLFSMSSVALAADPTDVNVNWDGTGSVSGSVDTGDSIAQFQSGGNYHHGQFTATDANNNPYGYGVDNNNYTMQSSITGGGSASLQVNRTDSKSSMYGPAGQVSFTGVGTDDGVATLANRSRTNFADMQDGNYGWQSNNHITVSGSSNYGMWRYMDSGAGNYAGISASGSGDASLTCMSSEARASRVKLGHGAGCYTNAKFDATGTGSLNLNANGNNVATTALVPGLSAQSFNIVIGWVNGTVNIPNYATTAN